MSAEGLFSLAGTLVLPGWALLIFLPRWKPSATWIAPWLIPGLLGLLYAGLIAGNLIGAEGGFEVVFGEVHKIKRRGVEMALSYLGRFSAEINS